jgi:hypothetical protein
MSDASDDTWRPIELVGGDGQQDAAGRVELATGQEERPCLMCRSWENVDKKRLIEHILSKGLKPNERGNFETPIAKDFKGRKSLELDPNQSGYCRRDGIVTDMLATCENWKPTRTIAEFQQRMRR